MEPFKTFAFNVRTKEGIKIDVNPPHGEKDFDFIKIDDIKIERKAGEPYSIKIISEKELECNQVDEGIICTKPSQQKKLFSQF